MLDSRGRTIELTRENADEPFDLDDLKDRIGIYDFPNPYGLEHYSGVCFKETGSSGKAKAIIQGKTTYDGRIYDLRQMALEQSAVDLGDEMVNVITSQRAFQLNARMVQTADELEQVISSLR